MIEKLKKFKNKSHLFIRRAYATDCGRWLMAIFLSFFLIGILVYFFHPVFMTIDDSRIRYIYAGYGSGEPNGNYLFCNVIHGTILSYLYRIVPEVSWYAVYQILLIGVGNAAVGKTIYKLCCKKQIKIGYAILIHVMTYIFLCCIATIMMHFEVTATIIGTVGISLLLGLDADDRKASQYFDLVLSAICFFLTYIVMKNCFYVLCCYFLVILLYHYLHMRNTHNNKLIFRITCCFLPLVIIGILTAGYCNNIAKDSEIWKDYLSYNEYRVPYWDYPHLTYTDNPELFKSIDWSEEFYNLAERMYFIDKRFNEQSLSSFVDPFSWFDLPDIDRMISNAKSSFSILYHDEAIALFQTLLTCIVLLVSIGSFYHNRKKKKHLSLYLSMFCNFGGTAFLICFLAIRGRLPLRAWLSCFIPFAVIMIIQLLRLDITDKLVKTKDMVLYARNKLTCAIIFVMCCLFFLNTFQRGIYAGYLHRTNNVRQLLSVEAYCISNKDNIYIYNPWVLQNYSAMSEYPDKVNRPVNMMPWGSSYIYTPAFYQQLEVWGYESFYTGNLFDENVYLITTDAEWENINLFLFLDKEYEGFRYEIVDWLPDGYIVCKLYKG